MRPEINRYKQRSDYSRTVRPRRASTRRASLDGHTKVKIAAPDATVLQPVAVVPEVDKAAATPSESTLSLSFSLPTLRQPPDANEAPSARSWRLALTIILAIIFFILGYHNLWHLTHKPATALLMLR